MALIKTYDNPFGAPGETIEGYVWIAEANFNYAGNFGRIVFFVHTSEAAANAGVPPIRTIQMDLRPGGRPEIKDGEGNVIAQAIPPFPQLMYDNKEVITALGTALYTLALGAVPEIIGATPMDLQPIEPPAPPPENPAPSPP